MAGTAYSFIPISTKPVYAAHTNLNDTSYSQDRIDNEIAALEAKKAQQRHDKSIKERDKSKLPPPTNKAD